MDSGPSRAARQCLDRCTEQFSTESIVGSILEMVLVVVVVVALAMVVFGCGRVCACVMEDPPQSTSIERTSSPVAIQATEGDISPGQPANKGNCFRDSYSWQGCQDETRKRRHMYLLSIH